jgi:glycosyltransferase involved in cell wall biosynthesis
MHSRVSVVIPTYNRSGLVRRAVQGALDAIDEGDEILVIDDGSTDDTPQALRPLCDRIRFVRKENSGPGATRNLGIRLAQNPLVAFLDSDDEWVPEKVRLQRDLMDALPHVVFCFSNLSARADGRIVHDILSLWKEDPRVGYDDAKSLDDVLGPAVPFSSISPLTERPSDFAVYVGDLYPALMEVAYVSPITAMVRKNLAGDSFQYPEDIRIAEDWECFARIAKVGPAAYLDCELAIQHVHRELRLTQVPDILQATARITVLQRVWGVDESFLRINGARYRSVLKTQYLRRAKSLISEVRLHEAKEDLAVAGGPWSYRLVTRLPSPLVKGLLGIRRKVRGRRGERRGE